MNRKAIRKMIFLLCLVGTGLVMTGSQGKTKTETWGDAKTGYILTYQMAENQALKYEVNSEQLQKMTIMEQSMETQSKSNLVFTVNPKGKKGENLLLNIKIDDMKIEANSPTTGSLKADLSSIIGKAFEMTLSTLGKELEFINCDTLEYNLGQVGKRNVKSSFRSIFPDLPGKPRKIGETWPSTEEVTENEGGADIKLVFNNVDKLEGLEVVDGLDCVKITGVVSGTLDGKGQQMGADFTIQGRINGISTWYFAYKKGILVKQVVESTTDGTVEITAQNMSIPMTTTTKSEIHLVQ